jgi:hypothetical protein
MAIGCTYGGGGAGGRGHGEKESATVTRAVATMATKAFAFYAGPLGGALNVKAQALLNAARYIEDEYGPEVLAEVLSGCSPAVRERRASAIAINWHPLAEFVEFLVAVTRVFPDPLIGEKIGAAAARANTRGVMLKVGLMLSKPENVLRRAAAMWRQFNDEGEMKLIKGETTGIEVVITGIPRTPRIFCDTVTGWARELVTSAGGKNAAATHTECRADGDSRCVWTAKWTGSPE